MSKLSYKIIGRRPLRVERVPGQNQNGPRSPGAMAQPDMDMEMVDVRWFHEDGFPPDMRDLPFKLPDVDLIVGKILEKAVDEKAIDTGTRIKIQALIRKVFVPHPDRGDLGILTVPDGERPFLGDQLTVPVGTTDGTIAVLLDEKRVLIARALGVEP